MKKNYRSSSVHDLRVEGAYRMRSPIQKFFFMCISICISFLIFFLIKKVIGVTYAINDDIFMQEIASGGITGRPDSHMIFIRSPLTYLFVFLFECFPNVDWYALVFYTLQIAAFSAFIYFFSQTIEENKWGGTVISHVFAVLYLICERLYSIILLQFTTTSMILVSTAFLIFMILISKRYVEQKFSNSLPEIIVLIFLVWFSYLIRKNILLLALPFIVGSFLLRLILSAKKKAILIRTSCVLLPVLILISISVGFEKRDYGSEDWTRFKDYNIARSNVYDHYPFPDFIKYKEKYNAIGLDETDVDMIKLYMLDLLKDVDADHLNQVARISKEAYIGSYPGLRIAFNGTMAMVRFRLDDIRYTGPILFAAIMALMALLRSVSSERRVRCYLLIYLLMSLFILMSIFFYFEWIRRFILRVNFAVLSFFSLSSLSILLFNESSENTAKKSSLATWKGQLLRGSAIVAMSVCVYLSWYSIKGDFREVNGYNRSYIQMIEQVKQWREKDHIVMYEPRVIGNITPGISFFKPPETNMMLTLGGWYAHSPLAQSEWSEHGLNLNDSYKVVLNPRVRVVLGGKKHAELLARYLEKKGIKIKYELEAVWADHNVYIELYRFMRA